MTWYRISYRALTKEQIDAGRTKHLAIQTVDIFAEDGQSAQKRVGDQKPDYYIQFTIIGVRELKCEWTPQQMAVALQWLSSQSVQTPAGPMKQMDSGVLVPV